MFDGPGASLMTAAAAMPHADGAAWDASLELQVQPSAGRSTCSARHRGPLRLQKALYPEGPAICHAVLIHPPGGIAGGDALTIAMDIAAGAHALVTTPGAAKWYKANGRRATQRVQLAVSGALEWLPQEAIVFDAADLRSSIDIDLSPNASTIGWDIVVLGRQAAGERFLNGSFAQDIRLAAAGELLWHERTRLTGGDALLDSPVGLDGHAVFGCLWAAGPAVAGLDLDALRGELPGGHAPLTRLAPALLVARVLAPQIADARSALQTVWSALRPRVLGIAAQPPRLWAT